MKNKHPYILLFAILLCASCAKEYKSFVPYEDQAFIEATSTDNFFESSQKQGETLFFTTDTEEILSKETKQGTVITISPNSFLNGLNEPIAGIINIEVIELDAQGEMMMYDKPTVLYLSEEMLDSEKQIYIRASQNGQELKLKEGKQIHIQTPSVLQDKPLKIYTGHQEGAAFYWENSDMLVNKVDNFGFEWYTNQLGWFNLAQVTNINSTSTLCIDLPPTYNYWNTLAFVAYKDINGLTRLYGDPIREEFCATLPSDLEAQLIIISLQDEDDYYYHSQNIMTNSNLEITINPSQENLQGILDILAGF